MNLFQIIHEIKTHFKKSFQNHFIIIVFLLIIYTENFIINFFDINSNEKKYHYFYHVFDLYFNNLFKILCC